VLPRATKKTDRSPSRSRRYFQLQNEELEEENRRLAGLGGFDMHEVDNTMDESREEESQVETQPLGGVDSDEALEQLGEDVLERERVEMVLQSAKNESMSQGAEGGLSDSMFFPNIEDDLIEDEDDENAAAGEGSVYLDAADTSKNASVFMSPEPLGKRDLNI
jgi:hypothetical protein